MSESAPLVQEFHTKYFSHQKLRKPRVSLQFRRIRWDISQAILRYKCTARAPDDFSTDKISQRYFSVMPRMLVDLKALRHTSLFLAWERFKFISAGISNCSRYFNKLNWPSLKNCIRNNNSGSFDRRAKTTTGIDPVAEGIPGAFFFNRQWIQIQRFEGEKTWLSKPN